MKNTFLFGLLMLAISVLPAQTLSRQVISSTGSANNQLSYTVGETVINTAISGSFILTQGFQQPDATAVNVEPPLGLRVDYKLYPNPSHNQMTLELNSEKFVKLKVDIVDMAGKLVRKAEDLQVEGTEKKQFDVSSFASGSYLLRIMNPSNEPVKTIKFERID